MTTHPTAMAIPTAVSMILKSAALSLAAVTWLPAAWATDITGAGSTFVYPVMLTWAASYYASTGVKVNYLAIGSGGGIQRSKVGSVAFGASDKPLAPAELQAAGLVQFPIVIGGVVPAVNLEGIKSGQLNFTGELLANIYLGNVTVWNDPAIAALNPDTKLPNLKISVAHRSDSSGTTFNWVNYLSKVSPAWKSTVGEGTAIKWPTGAAGNGNEGVARYVNYVKGSIGYVELAYALKHKLIVGKIRNKAGVFVDPSLASFKAAAASADWSAPDFYGTITEAPGADSWPIAATVFVLMPRQPKNAAQSAEALRFFRWSLEKGKSAAAGLDYVSLPDDLVKHIEEYWAQNIK